MQEFIKGIVSDPLFSIFTGLLGAWGGYRLAVSQERRKEFNEAAEVLFEELRNNVFRPDFEKFRRRVFWYQLWYFDHYVSEYEKATGEENTAPPNSFGRRVYIDESRIEKARQKLLKFTKRI